MWLRACTVKCIRTFVWGRGSDLDPLAFSPCADLHLHASTAGWNESQRSDSLTCASPQESTERHTRKWLTSSSPRMAQNLSMVLQIPVDLTTLPLTVDLTEEEVIRLRSVWTSVRSSF